MNAILKFGGNGRRKTKRFENKNWREAKEEEIQRVECRVCDSVGASEESERGKSEVDGRYVQSNQMSVFVCLCMCERVIVGWSCIEQKRQDLQRNRVVVRGWTEVS